MKLVTLIFAAIFGLFYQPGRPQVLIIGDSISIGYFPYVKDALKDKADVTHNAGNAQFSKNGVQKIKSWLGDKQWDVIQFNWGLWDIAYRAPATKGTGALDKVNGMLTATPEQYRENLEILVETLEKTGAKLIFVNTTYVPRDEPGRFSDDVVKYNAIAEEVMKKHGILVNDLYTPSKGIHKKEALGIDNVHYTSQGYKELSSHITRCLEKVILK